MTVKSTETSRSKEAPQGWVGTSHGDSMANENYAGGPRSLEDAEALLAEVHVENNPEIVC